MKNLFFLLFSFVLFVCTTDAQTKSSTVYNEVDFKTKPVWIDMMKDPAVNYYQAVKAFNTYWDQRVRPEDDADNKNGKDNDRGERKRRLYKKKLAAMTPAERNEFDRLNYQYKRFTNWMRDVKRFVQADGSIRVIRN